MMVIEHDWFYDMGEAWEHIFGPPDYSFDWKGEHYSDSVSSFFKRRFSSSSALSRFASETSSPPYFAFHL
jgi:hypothetical protein